MDLFWKHVGTKITYLGLKMCLKEFSNPRYPDNFWQETSNSIHCEIVWVFLGNVDFTSSLCTSSVMRHFPREDRLRTDKYWQSKIYELQKRYWQAGLGFFPRRKIALLCLCWGFYFPFVNMISYRCLRPPKSYTSHASTIRENELNEKYNWGFA